MNPVNKTKYTSIDDVYDTTDDQLCEINVDRQLYMRWLNNCLKNKSKTSWVYFYNKNNVCFRRKIKLIENGENDYSLTYNGLNKNEWGFIECS